MFAYLRNGRWLIASAFIVASCSQGDTRKITGPSGPSASPSGDRAFVSGSAAGDTKTGSGALELVRLRMDRQGPTGASVFRQYALPGSEYPMNPGETIELWAEWDPIPGVVPRLKVDWGADQPESPDNIHCGPCLLRHSYPVPGRYRVEVSLDDRNGTKIVRTFFLNSLPAPTPSPTISPTLTCTAPTLVPNPEEDVNCDEDGIFDTSQFFTGAGLTYALTGSGLCGPGNDPGEDVSINSATGVITALDVGDGDWCLKVTATNACGSVSHNFTFHAFCNE